MPAVANLVRVASSTTGTGTLTLGSAITGFLNPTQAGMVDGKVYSYAIEADFTSVGDDLVPTSREVGRGTYTASGTTLTRTVENSTNSNALLNLTGDEQVIITVTKPSIRERLDANRTYFVRTDGNNSNSGLADSAGGAFLTLQKAVDTFLELDFNNFTVTVDVGNGTYTGGAVIGIGWTGGGTVVFTGDTTTPSNVVISTTSASCFEVTAVLPGSLTIKGFKMTTATSGFGINFSGVGTVSEMNNEFGACADTHIIAGNPGAFLYETASTVLSGGATTHMTSASNALIVGDGTVTSSGSVNFTRAFAYATDLGAIQDNADYSGVTATGSRYQVAANAIIDTFGGGANHFPGNSGGTTATGGQYI